MRVATDKKKQRATLQDGSKSQSVRSSSVAQTPTRQVGKGAWSDKALTYASIFLLALSLVSWVLLLARTQNVQDTQVEASPTAQAEAESADSPTFKNIEDLQLGDRTLGKNPKEVFPAETDDSVFERIPHCAYSLCYVKEDGSRCNVKLLRPENWLEDEELQSVNVRRAKSGTNLISSRRNSFLRSNAT